MVVIDGIVYRWSPNGGVAVYYRELVKNLIKSHRTFSFLEYRSEGVFSNSVQVKARFVERYREAVVPTNGKLFHSSYYRLPSSSSIKIVTTVHDFTYERLFSGAKKLVHSWQKKRAILGSDAVICISESTKRDLFEFIPEMNPDRVHVVPNGVSDDFFRLERNEEYGSVDYPYCLFVGGRHGYKNFSHVLRTMELVPELKLVCVGGEALTVQERMQIEQLIPGRFSFEGIVTNGRLNELYNRAFCLFYASKYEGFGIPVLEAMRAGCPVVAVGASSIPEVAGDSALLVSGDNCEESALAIRSLMDLSFRSKVIEMGKRQAMNFSWENTSARIFEIYDKIL